MEQANIRWIRNERTGQWERVEIDTETKRRTRRIKYAAEWLQNRHRTRLEVANILSSYVLHLADKLGKHSNLPAPIGLVDDAEHFLRAFVAMPKSDYELAALATEYAGKFFGQSDSPKERMTPIMPSLMGRFIRDEQLGACVMVPDPVQS